MGELIPLIVACSNCIRRAWSCLQRKVEHTVITIFVGDFSVEIWNGPQLLLRPWTRPRLDQHTSSCKKNDRAGPRTGTTGEPGETVARGDTEGNERGNHES